MSSAPRTLTSVEQVCALLSEGWGYLDVRTREEYLRGRVPGAINVPWMLGSLEGLRVNPDFETELVTRVPAACSVIVGCRSGTRARDAAQVVGKLGYLHCIDALGFDGSRDVFGRLTPGWSRLGLPVETEEF